MTIRNPWVGTCRPGAHTGGMDGWKRVAQVSALVLMVFSLPALVWAISSTAPTDQGRPGISRVQDDDNGHGPPAWAQGHQAKHGKAAGKADGKAWKQLAPEERATLMRKLTTEHSEGMRAWGECVAAGRDDCSRPLPPGLAKRR